MIKTLLSSTFLSLAFFSFSFAAQAAPDKKEDPCQTHLKNARLIKSWEASHNRYRDPKRNEKCLSLKFVALANPHVDNPLKLEDLERIGMEAQVLGTQRKNPAILKVFNPLYHPLVVPLKRQYYRNQAHRLGEYHFSKSGRLVAAIYNLNTIYVWETSTGRPLGFVNHPTSALVDKFEIAEFPDGTFIRPNVPMFHIAFIGHRLDSMGRNTGEKFSDRFEIADEDRERFKAASLNRLHGNQFPAPNLDDFRIQSIIYGRDPR